LRWIEVEMLPALDKVIAELSSLSTSLGKDGVYLKIKVVKILVHRTFLSNDEDHHCKLQ